MTSNFNGLLQRQQHTNFSRGTETSKKSSTRVGVSKMGTAASSNSPNLDQRRRSSLTSMSSPRTNERNFRYGNPEKKIPPIQKQGSLKARALPPGMGPGMGSAASSFRTTSLYTNNNTPLQHRRGPLKADHSIDVNNNARVRLGSATHHEKKEIISPLSRRKSSSMSDLNTQQDDDFACRKFNFGSSIRNGEDKIKRHIKSNVLMDTIRRKTEQLSLSRAKEYMSTNDLRTSNRHVFMSDNDNDNRFSRRTSLDDGYASKRTSKDLTAKIVRNERKDRKSLDSAYDSGSSDSASPKMVHKSQSSADTKMRFGDGLVGLRNLGNTCFLNSILQCLCKSKPLRAYFCKDDYLRDINDFSATTKGKIAKAFADLMSEMWNSRTTTALSPGQLKIQVQKVAPRFCGYNQQDSQEFLRYLLEGVHDDLNQVKKKPTFPCMDDSKMSDREKSELYWNRYLQREKSVIQDLFVGMLKSTLTCCTCGHRSVTYDPFWDLSLPIPSRSRSSIHDVGIDQCFRSFTQEETLDGDEKPTCEKCKKRRKSTKGFLIERFPKLLVLHLKRFSGLRYRTKLETMVNFPHELNLKEFSANQHTSKNDPVYTLFGVSNHMGGTYGGHYTAYCRHPDTSKWHVYNDARVDAVPSSRVVSSSAYVLFYELRNPKAVL